MLTAGQSVKDFTLQDKDGKSISMSDFKGEKVVVYFYPKDDTPGCTRQACAFRDAYAGFSERKITVIGISKDSTRSHQKFAEKYNLPFILLADPDGTVIKLSERLRQRNKILELLLLENGITIPDYDSWHNVLPME